MEHVAPSEYELDYLITPELGGVGDARNLWPQRYDSDVWNARVKDDLERLLPRLVCDGAVDLGMCTARDRRQLDQTPTRSTSTPSGPSCGRLVSWTIDDEIQFETTSNAPMTGAAFVPLGRPADLALRGAHDERRISHRADSKSRLVAAYCRRPFIPVRGIDS